MDTFRHVLVLGVVCCAVLAVAAETADEASPWRLSAGAVYRDFGGVAFEGFTFRNYNNVNLPGGPFGIQNYSVLPGLQDGSGVTTDYVRYDGSGESSEDHWGFELALERSVAATPDLTWSVIVSTRFFELESSETATAGVGGTGDFSAAHYNYFVNDERVQAPPSNDQPLAGLSPGTSVLLVENDVDIELYAVDIGVRAVFTDGPVAFTGTAGPVFYVAELDTSQVESAFWNPIPGTGDPGTYRRGSADSEWDSTWGIFGALGAEVRLADRVSLAFEGRYDHANSDLGTSQATLDLAGLSGKIRVVLGF